MTMMMTTTLASLLTANSSRRPAFERLAGEVEVTR
jgi:hypothetical protein